MERSGIKSLACVLARAAATGDRMGTSERETETRILEMASQPPKLLISSELSGPDLRRSVRLTRPDETNMSRQLRSAVDKPDASKGLGWRTASICRRQ